MAPKPILVAIAGLPCSGKTELARVIANRFAAVHPIVLSMDCYYQDLAAVPPEKRETFSFDAPEAVDNVLLAKHLAALAQGQAIERPEYSLLRNRAREAKSTRVVPAPGTLILLEGALALYWSEIRDLCDIRVFLEIDLGVALQRRIERDGLERRRGQKRTAAQRKEDLRSVYEKHVLPTRAFADLVLDALAPVEHSANKIINRIAQLPERFERQGPPKQ